MTSSRFTSSRSLRRMRLRSVAVPFFLVTVKPTRTGPVVVAAAALQHEGSAVGPRAIGNGEEVRPLP